MRGPSKSLPKYAKHKASGRAVVRLNGTDIYLGPYGTKTSRLEYDRGIGEWLANGRRLPTKRDEIASITVAELCASYLRFAKSYYVKNGNETDEVPGIKAAIRFLVVSYSKTKVIDFGPLALEAVRDQIIAVGNSRGYINKTANRIRRMFKWGVAKELVPVQVYQALATVPGLKKWRDSDLCRTGYRKSGQNHGRDWLTALRFQQISRSRIAKPRDCRSLTQLPSW